MIFRYPGGKTKKSTRERILAKAPLAGYAEYREPFVGGGGIFFFIPKDKKRWINDIDNHLIEVYKALKERPEEFIAKCRSIAPETKEEALPPPIYNKRLKEQFAHFAENENCDQALRYFYVNRTVWAGRVNYDIKSRMYFSVPSGWNITKTDRLEQAAEYCRDAVITCTSYEELLYTPGKNVWIYCDPPYLVNTNFSRNSQLYKHSFTLKDHEKFADEVRTCKHKVCISYDDDDGGVVRSLFKGLNIHEEEWTYCGTSSAKCHNTSKVKKKGKELLICNY